MLCLAKPSLSIGRAAWSVLGKRGKLDGCLGNYLGKAVFTYRGRTALAAGCRLLGLKEGDEALAPSYNCGMEIDVLLALGYKVSFFGVNRMAQIDVEDLKQKITSRTKLIYITHYFGWDQNIQELAVWCDKNGLLMIEDCALSLFSNGASGCLGRLGHMAIYSFPKSLPVPDGGALVLRHWEEGKPPMLESPPWASVFRKTIGLVGTPLLTKLRAIVSREREDLGPGDDKNGGRRGMPFSYYFSASEMRWAISRVTSSILGHTRPEEIVRKRRSNYEALYDGIKGIREVKPLVGKLPPGVCPLCLPVIVDNRFATWQRMRARGVTSGMWWSGYHKNFPWDDFPDACFLKDNLLALPIHQDLDSGHIEYIAETLLDAVRHGN